MYVVVWRCVKMRKTITTLGLVAVLLFAVVMAGCTSSSGGSGTGTTSPATASMVESPIV